jgi:phosphoribosylamine--glycine ligase
LGIEVVPSGEFDSPEKAIKFVQENEGPWVLKQNGHIDKIFNYVGRMQDGSDVVAILESYCQHNRAECARIDLQKKIEGVEIGVARYFNGHDWVGPIELNIEHKDLHAGGVGPKTYEMGTLLWYEENEANKLFQTMLAPFKPYLQKIQFKGDIDVDCIVNEDGVYPLEITPRFGWPSTHLHTELHLSPWGDFLKAVADGKPYDLKYKKGYSIAVLVATPPFPYQISEKKYSPVGERIYFHSDMTADDLSHLHFEDVSKDEQGNFYISGESGFVLHVTAEGETVEAAREKAQKIIDKIVIPKMFYRNDIGLKFMNEDQQKLKQWGWI